MNTPKKAPCGGGANSQKTQYPTTQDFARINAAALSCLERIAEHFAPGGKRNGREYLPLNPRRADSRAGSFSINLDSGKWSDFATGESGGDPISLVAYLLNCGHQSEALRALADFLGMPAIEGDHPGPAPAAPAFKRAEPIPEPRSVMPIPADAPATANLHKLGNIGTRRAACCLKSGASILPARGKPSVRCHFGPMAGNGKAARPLGLCMVWTGWRRGLMPRFYCAKAKKRRTWRPGCCRIMWPSPPATARQARKRPTSAPWRGGMCASGLITMSRARSMPKPAHGWPWTRARRRSNCWTSRPWRLTP